MKKLYPIQEYMGSVLDIRPKDMKDVKAQMTGEFRPPKAGEWFISGDIPGAYRAKHDFSTPYNIAKLVRVKTVTTEIIVGDYNGYIR